MHTRHWSIVLLIALLILLGTSAAGAQSTAVITLTLPQYLRQLIEGSGTIEAFEQANPGVDVVVDYTESIGGLPLRDIEGYLEAAQELVEQGDIVYIGANSIAPEATRAGLFLDLAPLVNGDPSLNVADFFPAVWQSFQWDGGVWALPVSTNITGLTYNPDAFDAAGLAHPNPAWTIDDLANAARTLAVRDSSGQVITPGLIAPPNNVALLFRSLLGQPFYDNSTLPANPRLATPELESLLATWKTLVDEGVVAVGSAPGSQAPMSIGAGFVAVRASRAEDGSSETEIISETESTLLPGGSAALSPSGFAVSAGTQYPEQAYALARFLTTRPEISSSFSASNPARQSLVGVPATTDSGGFIMSVVSPQMQAFIDEALPNALPYSESRFANYVATALNAMISSGVDALTALQNAEASAFANLQTADAMRGQIVVAVATPVPTPVLQAGEIVLRFGVAQGNLITANEALWNQVIDAFVAADPQVGQVVLDSLTPIGADVVDMAANFDCFYMPNNVVPDLDLSLVLNLDPFMDADPSFDRSDIVGNTLAQLQRDNRTWGYPLTIQPIVMRYDREQFARAGVPEPTSGWTVDTFVDALQRLQAAGTGDGAPFTSSTWSSTNILMLIAAFGGLPFDYRTTPETINLTDPAAVAAIQQVLDLAKNGLMSYYELGALGPGTMVTPASEKPAISTETLGSVGGIFGGGISIVIAMGPGSRSNDDTDTALTTFPSGTQYTPLAYNVGAAYISATAQNPDACYRLIGALAQHPELFDSMPARRSLINSPQVIAAHGADAAAVFNQIDALMQNPSTVVFPTFLGSGTPATFLTQLWMNRAFDAYVIEDADLATELADAQRLIDEFNACVAALPPVDPAQRSQPSTFNPHIECATQVDPSLSEFFGA